MSINVNRRGGFQQFWHLLGDRVEDVLSRYKITVTHSLVIVPHLVDLRDTTRPSSPDCVGCGCAVDMIRYHINVRSKTDRKPA